MLAPEASLGLALPLLLALIYSFSWPFPSPGRAWKPQSYLRRGKEFGEEVLPILSTGGDVYRADFTPAPAFNAVLLHNPPKRLRCRLSSLSQPLLSLPRLSGLLSWSQVCVSAKQFYLPLWCPPVVSPGIQSSVSPEPLPVVPTAPSSPAVTLTFSMPFIS